ncbi:MAG: hypothetical protein IJW12_03065 [Opitutales bacterium]|nr:hypothetical protein [Opitutales bacterium]
MKKTWVRLSMRKIFTLLFSTIFAGTLLCAFSACNYSLGNRAKLPFATIEVAPIVNNADIPQAQAMLARDVAEALNGTPRLATVIENGAAELQIEISGFRRNIAATSSEDSMIASIQNLTLELNCSLLNTRSGKYFFRNRKVSVSTDVYTGAAAGLGESQSFPVLSREAARKVRDLVVNVW